MANIDNFLPWSSIIRKTSIAIGVVVYTGH